MNREYYLDNLKVFLTVLVIFHHAGQAYGWGGSWAYTPSNSEEFMPWIWHFFSVNAAFFMGLFFMISGYFVPLSYDKQGGKVFVKKKLLHLGVPLLVFGSMTACVMGGLDIAHMWYVESLLVFCLIYALVRRYAKPITKDCISKPSLTGMAVVGLLMGVGSYLIRIVSPQNHWIWPLGIIPLPMEPAHYLQYVMMFVMGILAKRFNWLEKLDDKIGTVALSIGVMLSAGIYAMDGGWWNDLVNDWYGIYESMLCIFMCYGLIWLFKRYFGGSSDFMKWCSSQAYGAYLVHLLLMLAIQHAADGVWMGAVGKFVFVGVVTTIVSFVVTWLLKQIPGVKRVI